MTKIIGGALLATAVSTGGAMAATINQGTGYALDSTGYGLFTVADLANPVPPSDPRSCARAGSSPRWT